jgi:hypothetical protein
MDPQKTLTSQTNPEENKARGITISNFKTLQIYTHENSMSLT